jgi:hypothetical protein
MEGLEAAIDSLKLSNSINYRATALKFKCSETTLRRRYQGLQVSRADAAFSGKSLLSKEQEKTLVAYINKLTRMGIPPTPSMVRNFAGEVAKTEPGKNWATKFIKRHSNELDCDWLKGAELSRSKADNLITYKKYFDQVSERIYL